MTVVVGVLIWVVCAGFAALIAQNQRRPPGWYAVAGLLLGPIGLLIAAFATPGDVLQRQQAAKAEAVKARKASMPWADADGL